VRNGVVRFSTASRRRPSNVRSARADVDPAPRHGVALPTANTPAPRRIRPVALESLRRAASVAPRERRRRAAPARSRGPGLRPALRPRSRRATATTKYFASTLFTSLWLLHQSRSSPEDGPYAGVL